MTVADAVLVAAADICETAHRTGDVEQAVNAIAYAFAAILHGRPAEERGQIVDRFVEVLPGYVLDVERAS